MDRTGARAAAMKLLYEWEMGGEGGEDTRLGMLDIQPDENEADYMDALVEGVRAHAAELDALVSKYAVGWRLERINRVDLSILRVAIYEISFEKLAPAVAVNEALELARTYSTPEAVSFINGVLGSLLRGL
ncbi:MAG: transcription antitermination factor NusB [Clostridia bacterium]|nr:transcription antitermination factor NusB [Clostridia bacterium]MBO4886303.1 transcription antitermination factor NusB [Clostridia bacterium]MBR4441969.1 transcription antitermination factor NusB [Clostridia bacterium]